MTRIKTVTTTTQKHHHRQAITLGLSCLVSCLGLQVSSSWAVNLKGDISPQSSADFPPIADDFLGGGVIDSQNAGTTALSEQVPLDNLLLVLEITPLSPVFAENNRLSLDSVISSLSRVRLDGKANKIEDIQVRVLEQTTVDRVYDGIYTTPVTSAPQAPERLVGNYLNLTNSNISAVNLPKNYFFNDNSVSLSIFQVPSLSLTLPNNLAQSPDLGSVALQKGVKLNRVRPQTNSENDSTLQLWPRSPFKMEVSGDADNALSIFFKETENYGSMDIDVNFAMMPKNILVTTLDLQVDWVNSGDYSQNLRDTIDTFTENNREGQAKFESRVEAGRQKWALQQRNYLDKVQQGVSQQFQSIQKSQVPKPYNSSPTTRYSTQPKDYNSAPTSRYSTQPPAYKSSGYPQQR